MKSIETKSKVLLRHHLKALRLPTVSAECEKVAAQCAADNVDHLGYLLSLLELELLDREKRSAERRMKAARFPTIKTLDTFDFVARPSVNKMLITELTRCEYIDKRENVLLIGNPGTGKSHLATALAAQACAKGYRVRFFRTTELVTTLIEARDERTLLRLKGQLAKLDLLVLDELGYVPASKVGAELLFDVISTAYERTSLIVTSNVPFESWTEVLGSERLTGATLGQQDAGTHDTIHHRASAATWDTRSSRRPVPASTTVGEGAERAATRTEPDGRVTPRNHAGRTRRPLRSIGRLAPTPAPLSTSMRSRLTAWTNTSVPSRCLAPAGRVIRPIGST
jgi:DNA replication protein DnaC